ncbi:MAG TPA: hypothetical protein DHW40_07995 [Microbacterium sp.]|nr:hypothetical protein [Microbacterium sp.]
MGGTNATRIDALITDLRALRAAKSVSYRDLAARITDRRIADGKNPAAARVPHTTISDAFRLGRRRLNAALIAEIVAALDEDPTAVDAWRARVAAATAVDAVPDPIPDLASTPTARRPPGWVFLLILAGVLLNATGKFVNPLLGDVFFFDMIGTAVVAILAGPWAAAGVGALFILVELLKGQLVAALFSVTMVTAGLVWGFGTTRFGMASTLTRFLGLSAIVAATTSLIAVPITVLYLGGATDRGLDALRDTVMTIGSVDSDLAIGIVNLTISVVDKLAVGAAAYAIARVVGSTGSVGVRPAHGPRLEA